MNRQYTALNGVAILLIVLNHAIYSGLQVSPVEGPWLKVLVVLQALGAFAVPIFLFVSGAFLAYAAREFTATFVTNSLARILWPYVIWSCVFYAVMYTAAGVRSSPLEYVKNLVVGYPYHFVPLLVFWYLATPVLVWIGRRHGAKLLALIALWQIWLLVVRFPEWFGLQERLPELATSTVPPVLFTSMAEWGIYFPLGLVMGLHGAVLKPRLERARLASALAAAAVLGLGLLNALTVADAPWARVLAPVPLMFLLPVIDRRSIPWLDFHERLGRRSYGIYLTHFVVLNALVLAIGTPGREWWPPIVFASFLVGALGASLLGMELMSRVGAGRRFYRYLFGIVPPATIQRHAA